MTTHRKIETGCYAIIRATGEPVTVGRRYPGYRGLPDEFATHLGCFRSGELQRITQEQYASAEDVLAD